MPTLDLPPKHLRVVLDALHNHVPHAEVWAYGSRAGHTAHESSDLDLVVRNPSQLEVPQKNLHRLRDALAESHLPLLVEVFDWARIPDDFRQEIQRQPVVALTGLMGEQ
jgi:predicted nucleotidyltransferase